jgi:4-hydroxy-3-methylbut-2-enyl diphosphate reductase
MKITKAETAGFCFGVNRAVNMVYELLNEGKKVCTLGPIIHNPQLVEELSLKGVRIVENPDEVNEDETLVIRSHGVEREVFENAKQKGIDVADATCPFVAKIHNIVSEKSKEGYITLIAGDPNHQEVKGIIGHCYGECHTLSNLEELQNFLKNSENIAEKLIIMVSQTTFNAEIWAFDESGNPSFKKKNA